MLSTAVLMFGIKEHYRRPKQRPPLYMAPIDVAKAAFARRNILIMLLILLFSSYGNYSVLMFLTLFMNRTLNVTIGNAVLTSVITYALTAVLAIPFGNLADRCGKKNAMIFGQIVGIMALLTGLLAQSIEHMYLFFVFVAIAQTAFRVTFYPLLTQFMPRDKIGTISGAIPIFFSTARVLAGLTAGRIIDAFGENYRVAWVVALACAIPTLVFVLMVDPSYRADQEEQGSGQ
jgi:MFS family permease